MKTALLYAVLMLHVLAARAEPRTLVEIADPPGDDYGAGALVYPKRSDFQKGDLDLLQFRISRDDDGFWFEATFKNPIRDPAGVAVANGNESLSDFARKGFYEFNIDVYVDTDRIEGSGNTFTLPGRHVTIDPAYAWEKAVILTPRPELMREQLLDTLAEQFPDRLKPELEATLDRAIFFPTQIRVRGKSIAFFAPAGFFAGSDGADWAVTAFVTGAITNLPANISFLPSAKKPLDALQLGVMQPAAGYPRDTFGYSGATPSPVVDFLSPSPDQQTRQLAAMSNLTGISWGLHGASGAAPAKRKSGEIAAEPRTSFADLFRPASVAGTQPPEGGVAGSKRSVVERMRILQQLFDQKLIDEAEYKRQKERILNDL